MRYDFHYNEIPEDKIPDELTREDAKAGCLYFIIAVIMMAAISFLIILFDSI